MITFSLELWENLGFSFENFLGTQISLSVPVPIRIGLLDVFVLRVVFDFGIIGKVELCNKFNYSPYITFRGRNFSYEAESDYYFL